MCLQISMSNRHYTGRPPSYLTRLAVLQHNLVNLLKEVIGVSPIVFIKYSTHWLMWPLLGLTGIRI